MRAASSSLACTTRSAPAEGVGARRSATKSAIVKSVSWPTAEIVGMREAGERARHLLLVERPQVLEAAAAARHDQHVEPRHAVAARGCPARSRRAPRALHARRIEQHARGSRSARAARAGCPGSRRRWARSRCRCGAAAWAAAASARRRTAPPCRAAPSAPRTPAAASPCRAAPAPRPEIWYSPRGAYTLHAAADQHLHAVLRPELHERAPPSSRPPRGSARARPSARSTSGPTPALREVRDLALDPDVEELRLQHALQAVGQLGDGQRRRRFALPAAAAPKSSPFCSMVEQDSSSRVGAVLEGGRRRSYDRGRGTRIRDHRHHRSRDRVRRGAGASRGQGPRSRVARGGRGLRTARTWWRPSRSGEPRLEGHRAGSASCCEVTLMAPARERGEYGVRVVISGSRNTSSSGRISGRAR